MKQVILSITLVLAFGLTTVAQQPSAKAEQKQPVMQPLVLVDDFETSLNLLILDPSKISSVDVLKDQTAIDKYGAAAKGGAVIIKTKDGVTLLRLQGILEKFQVADSFRKLPIAINDVEISNPELIVADASMIENIEIFTVSNWSDFSNPKSKQVLNIITLKQQK